MLHSMSTRNSGSSWLNRLRSSKGFPADQNLNLEQFIMLQNPTSLCDTTTIDHYPNSIPPQNPGHNRIQPPTIPIDDEDCSTAMTNVLAELFVMGDYQNLPQKKGNRKQLNPKNHALPDSPNSPAPVSLTEGRERVTNGGALDDEDEDAGRIDLSAFSRTEVTVIDTSFEKWKFEKVLFRRKNVWKVRDKKCKSVINVGRKKRKGSDLDDFHSEKKSKICSEKYNFSNGSVNEGLHHIDRVEEVCKEGQDNLAQTIKTRLHRKLKKGSSSDILVKNIHTPTKIGKSNEKCLPKSSQRLHNLLMN